MAIPIIQTTGSVSGAGTAGEGRNDLVAAELITLSDEEAANAGADYVWTMTDRPIGSTAVLLNPTSPNPVFTVDASGAEGSYKIRCLVNNTDESFIIIGLPLPNTGARIPSFQEEAGYNAGGNTKGWHESQTYWMRSANSRLPYLLSADPTVGGVSAPAGSIGLRDNAGVGEFWLKTGTGDTDWTEGAGGGTGGVEQDSYERSASFAVPYDAATTYEATLGRVLFDGSVVGLSAHLVEPLTGGSVTVNVHTAGASPAISTTLNLTNPQSNAASATEGDLAVLAGDEIYVEVVANNYVNEKLGNPESGLVVYVGLHRHPAVMI